LFGAAVAAQTPVNEPPKNKPAPAIRVAVERLKPDVVFDLAGTRGVGTGDGSIWLSLKEAGTVVRVDPKTNKVTETITLPKPPCPGMTFESGAMWVPLCGTAGIARVDAKTNTVTTTVTKGIAKAVGSMWTGVGSLWVIADDKGTLARIDPVTGAVVAEIYTSAGASGLASGQDALWLTNASTNQLARITMHTNLIAETIKVGKSPVAVAFGEGAAWTLNAGDATVSRIDPKTNKVTETIKLGVSMTTGQLVVGEGSVWVSGPGAPLVRIDPRTNQVAQIFTGVGGGFVALAEGSVWIAADAKTLWRLDPKRIEATR